MAKLGNPKYLMPIVRGMDFFEILARGAPFDFLKGPVECGLGVEPHAEGNLQKGRRVT